MAQPVAIPHSDLANCGSWARQLELKGHKVWNPEMELLPGDEWTGSLKKALADSEAMVVLLSPDTADSRWVSYELEYALSAKHLSGRLIPVLTRPTKNLPWILREMEMIHSSDDAAEVSRQIVEQLATKSHHEKKRARRKPAEAFLSHSSKNNSFATRLARVLAAASVPVFFSKKSIRGAQEWHDQIGSALKHREWGLPWEFVGDRAV